jgi:pimeloyl-ACP methyl ester carboxylesterase
VRHFPDAGHWVQLDAPEAVNAEIVEWLRAGRGKAGGVTSDE